MSKQLESVLLGGGSGIGSVTLGALLQIVTVTSLLNAVLVASVGAVTGYVIKLALDKLHDKIKNFKNQNNSSE